MKGARWALSVLYLGTLPRYPHALEETVPEFKERDFFLWK